MPETLAKKLRQAARMLSARQAVPDLPELLYKAAELLHPAYTEPTTPADTTCATPPGLLVLEADGGSRGNPGPAGAGAVLRDQEGLIIKELNRFLGITTNNVAEYQALIMGLKAALFYGPDKLLVKLDSELLVKQLNGNYQVKSENLKPLYLEAKSLLGSFTQTEIIHISRELNFKADALANQAMDKGK